MVGEPVFKGTRIRVRMITSMLADGADEAVLLEGYPKLTPANIGLARIWARNTPRPRTSEAAI